MIRAITEWDLRICGLEKVGQRAMDVARVFSGRYVESMKRNHYHIMGWDVDSGIPTRARLEDMGIGWVAEQLG
jgi:aldehyde:ferredoxin oxidoreductase